jgi:hypothetical protein
MTAPTFEQMLELRMEYLASLPPRARQLWYEAAAECHAAETLGKSLGFEDSGEEEG